MFRKSATGHQPRRISFRKSQSGVAAVEFALILPVMILIYLGMIEVTVGVNQDRKLTIFSRTLADLTGRIPTVNAAEFDNIFGAARSVMAPYDGGAVRARISSVVVIATANGGTEARVCWSEGRNGMAARARGQVMPVPEGFNAPNSSFILAESELDYRPMFGHTITNTITLRESTPWPVRNVAEVVRNNQPCIGSPPPAVT